MNMKLLRILLLSAIAANAELVSRGQNTEVGARALSLGGGFTGIADDYSALYYNPAGMTQLQHSELGLNLDYSLRTNSAAPANGAAGLRSMDGVQLSNFSLVLTQGEGWAFGLGYYSPVSYNDPLLYSANGRTYSYYDAGSMDHYRLAFAFAPSSIASIGFAATFLNGRDQLEIKDNGTVRYLEEYGGVNFEPSFMLQLFKGATLGGSAVVVEHLELHDTYQEQGGAPVETDYSIRNPVQLRLGLGYLFGLTQLALDWHGVFWNDYAYAPSGTDFYQNDPSYSNRNTFSIGIEQHLAHRGPVLHGGLSWEAENPNPLEPVWISHPKTASVGFGLPISKNLILDAGYQYRYASYVQPSLANGPADLTVAEKRHQVMGSLRFRW